jgi:hypothetical protein
MLAVAQRKTNATINLAFISLLGHRQVLHRLDFAS